MSMRQTIWFILNRDPVRAETSPGTVLLDYIREEARLKGTKIGCREGDCGACTVLVGELRGDTVVYQNVNSCLMPLGNASGKHILTIEGLNLEANQPNPIQAAFIEEGATQCGFCTPGFIVSLAGHCLSGGDAIAAIGGNICRCTGYKSIERAVARLGSVLQGNKTRADLVRAGVLPDWLDSIPPRLGELGDATPRKLGPSIAVGGGTDLYVQRPEELESELLQFQMARPELREIRQQGDTCIVGGSVSMEELARSDLMLAMFPDLPRYMKLVGSQQIRNQATLAGNFANASPIGDMTIFFLALDATLRLRRGEERREVLMRRFYRGYKDVDLRPYEQIESVCFRVPAPNTSCNFEKVSKRRHLDIATVNAAISYLVEDGVITRAHCSAGGVAPVPLYLEKTSAFLVGKALDPGTVRDAARIGDAEISPISDVRGSASYKKLLFRQLFYAHFLKDHADLLEPEALEVLGVLL